MGAMTEGEFYVHLADAIEINKARRRYYGKRTRGRSRRLSHSLIWFERVTLPIAVWLDWRARPFNQRGIPIVEGDFQPMTAILPAETPPRFTRTATGAEMRSVRAELAVLKRALRPTLGAGDFAGAADATLVALRFIEELEESTATHHAMSKHIVESIGIACANAIRYAEMSGGETVSLAKTFIKIQALALDSTTLFDGMAQAIHGLGVGIVVNDVPDIPFKAAWSAPTAAAATAAATAGAPA